MTQGGTMLSVDGAPKPVDLSALDKWRVAREMVQHEDGLINHRMVNYLTVQAFSATAATFLMTKMIGDFSYQIAWFMVVIEVLCVCGFLSGVWARRAIFAAIHQIQDIEKWWRFLPCGRYVECEDVRQTDSASSRWRRFGEWAGKIFKKKKSLDLSRMEFPPIIGRIPHGVSFNAITWVLCVLWIVCGLAALAIGFSGALHGRAAVDICGVNCPDGYFPSSSRMEGRCGVGHASVQTQCLRLR